MTYECEYFQIQELVPKSVYEDRGERAWQLLDDRLLRQLDLIRLRFGPTVINNWHRGGDRQWSGLRTNDSPYGSEYSQHRFGRAADCLFLEAPVEEVRQAILSEPDNPEFRFIGSVELDTSWLHFDVRNCDRIMTYRP